ncbi:sodium/glutamate symporter [soil metagenome]
MVLSAWWLLLIAVPVLLLGEQLVRRIPALSRVDMPVPVVGGFVIAVAFLVWNLFGTRGIEWLRSPAPSIPIYLPLSTAFFTCVGLNASWSVARRGSWLLLILLSVATVLAVLQNLVGVGLARSLGVSPYVGLLCGSVTLTGGPSTAIGFSESFKEAGFADAAVVGTAAAMFGIVTGSLLGGTLGGLLIRRHRFKTSAEAAATAPAENGSARRALFAQSAPTPALAMAGIGPNPIVHGAAPRDQASSFEPPPNRLPRGFVNQVRALIELGPSALVHLAILLACMKLGAWVSWELRSLGAKFPVYMGAMLVGITVRNLLDAGGAKILSTYAINLIGSVTLALFLAIAMSSLNLLQLRTLAAPMLVILLVQVGLMLAFAWLVTFNLMGRDYEAAVASAGHVGFGLGITPNAVATMDVLTAKFGAAPRAFLCVTIVGAFLIDFTNALTITGWMNWLK